MRLAWNVLAVDPNSALLPSASSATLANPNLWQAPYDELCAQGSRRA